MFILWLPDPLTLTSQHNIVVGAYAEEKCSLNVQEVKEKEKERKEGNANKMEEEEEK